MTFRTYDPRDIVIEFKGIEFKGFSEPGFFARLEDDVPPLPPPPTPVDLKRERTAKWKALANLWRDAARELNVRHADPRVRVEISVLPWSDNYEKRDYAANACIINFEMRNLRDTGTRDKIIPGAFILQGTPTGWPGRRAAQIYLSALWALFGIHENLELITHRGTEHWRSYRHTDDKLDVFRTNERPVVDPHSNTGANQMALSKSYDVASTMDWAIGLGEGQKILERNHTEAQQEFENELAFELGSVPHWE